MRVWTAAISPHWATPTMSTGQMSSQPPRIGPRLGAGTPAPDSTRQPERSRRPRGSPGRVNGYPHHPRTSWPCLDVNSENPIGPSCREPLLTNKFSYTIHMYTHARRADDPSVSPCCQHSAGQRMDRGGQSGTGPHSEHSGVAAVFGASAAGTGHERPAEPHSPLAEAADLKSAECRFESDWGTTQTAGVSTFELAEWPLWRNAGALI